MNINFSEFKIQMPRTGNMYTNCVYNLIYFKHIYIHINLKFSCLSYNNSSRVSFNTVIIIHQNVRRFYKVYSQYCNFGLQ